MGTIEDAAGPALTLAAQRRRNLPAAAAFVWLGQGWRDLWHNARPSLAYGLLVFAVSAGIVWGLFRLQLDYILFPALAGFMVVGPLVAGVAFAHLGKSAPFLVGAVVILPVVLLVVRMARR